MISEDIARRNLTPGQRAAVADKLANLPKGGTGANQYKSADLGNPRSAITQAEAAERIGTTPQASGTPTPRTPVYATMALAKLRL